MRNSIISGFLKYIDKALVSELIDAFDEMKRHHFLRDYRPSAVDAGRFAEVVFRILEQRTTGGFTSLGKPIDTEKIINLLSNIPSNQEPDSVRIHIPRTLRVIYDIRNKRNNAHLGDGIDPNVQDSIFVISCCDWVIAELIRLYHDIPANEAQLIIDELVQKKSPIIQEFQDGFLKTLNPKLNARERILITLYHRNEKGATKVEISNWLKPSQRSNLNRSLRQMEFENDLIRTIDNTCFITTLGQQAVEELKII